DFIVKTRSLKPVQSAYEPSSEISIVDLRRGEPMRGLEGTTISFQSVYRFIRQPAWPQNCEICGAALVAGHEHLIEPAHRKLLCACDACALLFGSEGSKYKRVPR